jgi:haloalkane dehalogenase
MSPAPNVLRTPDDRFANLPGYDFEPHYLDITDANLGTLRVHYVDEGPRDGQIVLMMHGEPSWCYLYRKMITPMAAAGFRVIAPDLIGFGRSDKPVERDVYTYASHVDWMTQWFDAVGINDVTLFCQDWGGLIGLRLVAAQPDRFARVSAGNTFLPTGENGPSEAFESWKKFSQDVPVFPTGGIIRGGTARGIDDAVEAAYGAPYPDETYKAGARQFPILVPVAPDMPGAAENREAWETLKKFDKPFLCLFSDKDPVTAGADKVIQKLVPGTKGQPHATIENGGHFLQEDAGEEIADHLIKWLS